MTEDSVKRKLRAILSADVKGYSRMMGEDEIGTYQTLTANLESIRSIISEHDGRVFSSPGDAVMAEFSSVVYAVQCAVKLQENIEATNADVSDDQKMQFRIGVNLGDVIHDGKQVYGDGVNIAARIETLAEPGGVSISRTVYNHVRNKLKFGYEYQGEHQVKNIKEPVRVYKVIMDSDISNSLVKEPFELPDKPSIAVLPFSNMSGDPSQEYFSDGLTDQIINGLCKISNLFVIARNSSFAYKGKAISVRQIGKELGVRYILEGSVQKARDRVRITAQLIDATTDYHMWSESYDRNLSDIFALQDEITMKLISAMEVNLISGEQARLWEGGTSNIQAYDKHMRGSEYFFRNNQKDNKQAQKYFKEAINIDKSYAFPYATLGFTHILDFLYRWSDSPIKSFEQAEKCAEKALALNDSLDFSHIILGWIYLYRREHNKAIKEGERAIELNPNGAEAHGHLGFILCLSDETELAIKLLERAFRLNPIPNSYYYIILAMALRNNGQYEKAIEWSKKGLKNNSDQLSTYLTLTACYIYLNRTEEAYRAAEEVLRIDPNFSLEYQLRAMPYKNQETGIKFVDALRKAGLPE